MFEVILSPEARAFYAKADLPLARKLARCFAQLEREPRPRGNNNIKRLSGEFAGLLRYRVGDWRVVFRIDNPARQVHIFIIAHRSEVYE